MRIAVELPANPGVLSDIGVCGSGKDEVTASFMDWQTSFKIRCAFNLLAKKLRRRGN
jgi:hypothetical protein